jgi:hypothetical protein
VGTETLGTMRKLASLFVALAAVTALAGPALAQDAPRQGVAFLGPDAPSSVEQPSSRDCGEMALHGVQSGLDTPAKPEKAYTSRSTTTAACPTYFRGAIEEGFNVTQPPTVDLSVGCENPTLFGTGFDNVQLEVTRSDEPIATGNGSVSPRCQSGDVLETTIETAWTNDTTEQVAFTSEDTIGLNVTVFGGPNDKDNVHVLVDGTETPSAIHAPGLFEPPEPDTKDPEPATNDTNTSAEAASESDDRDGNGVPGVGIVLAAASLAAVAVLVRREA